MHAKSRGATETRKSPAVHDPLMIASHEDRFNRLARVSKSQNIHFNHTCPLAYKGGILK